MQVTGDDGCCRVVLGSFDGDMHRSRRGRGIERPTLADDAVKGSWSFSKDLRRTDTADGMDAAGKADGCVGTLCKGHQAERTEGQVGQRMRQQ
jgi:hypothetical protein